jgi:hypothetical protein
VKVPALTRWLGIAAMRVEKVLRMTFRVVHLPGGVMPPSTDGGTACGNLGDNIAAASGQLAPTIPDDRRRSCHIIDFIPPQA